MVDEARQWRVVVEYFPGRFSWEAYWYVQVSEGDQVLDIANVDSEDEVGEFVADTFRRFL